MGRLLLIILVCFTFGCSRNGELDLADGLLNENPDSSLLILRQWRFDNPSPSTRKWARYSLLMSRALYKNYIDVSSDTIISPAVKYYSSRKGRERMLSYFHLGLVYRNMGSFPASIVALEKAEGDAIDLNDTFYLGLINRNKAELYNQTGNNPSAVLFSKKALDYFTLANADVYVKYAKLSLATAYLHNKEFEQSLLILNALSEEESKDEYLLSNISLIKAHALWSLNAPANETVMLYHQVPKAYYDVLDYGRIAESLETLGQRDSADYWLKVAYSLASDEDYKAALDYRKALLENSRGHYKNAAQLLRHVLSYEDSLTRIRLTESLSAAQRDYFKQDRDIQMEQAKTANVRLTLWILVSVFFLTVVILLAFFRLRSEEARFRESLASLHSSETAVSKLSSDNAFLVGGIVNEKIKGLESLSEKYCQAEDDAERKAILREYKAALEKFRDNEAVFDEIEQMLNQYCGNLMARFREQFPGVKRDKLRMVTLFFTRIPYKKAELFFRYYTADTLKKAKSRLVADIQHSNAPDKALFLDALEMKKGGRRS